MDQEKFVIAKRDEAHKNNAWFKHCEKEQIPYVVVEPRVKYALVYFDYTNLTKSNEQILLDNWESINKIAVDLYDQYSIKRSLSSIKKLAININDVPIHNAPTVAEAIFDAIRRFL